MLKLKTLEINNSADVTASIIWLHGLGADGHDFAPLAEMLQLAEVRFILPHAPLRPVTINGGFVMPAWYDLYGLEIGSRQDEAGIRQAQGMIEALVVQEQQRGIATNRILLAGFSQGGAIALHTALRYPQRLAGVLALSTYLPLKTSLAQEASAANRNLPIFMAHGTFDTVISLDVSRGSADLMIRQGYPLSWHEYPMAHSVCEAEITDIREFLCQLLSLE